MYQKRIRRVLADRIDKAISDAVLIANRDSIEKGWDYEDLIADLISFKDDVESAMDVNGIK